MATDEERFRLLLKFAGIKLYPGFGAKSPTVGRLRRLETGAQRIQGDQLRFSRGVYRRVAADVLTDDDGINITSSKVKKKGGVSVSGNTSGFAFTCTASSITWYWDGTNNSRVIVIHRADGSRFTVPTSGSPLTVTGLAAATRYYFLPFWDVNNLCNIGWVQGTVGSPQIAFVLADVQDVVNSQAYLISQTLQSREALTGGYMSAATTGGTPPPGGGGGGGGGGHCVMAGTVIEPLGTMEYSVNVRGNNDWLHLATDGGKELLCTLDHPLYHAIKGKLEARFLVEGDTVITDSGEQRIVRTTMEQRKCSLWEVIMKKGHLFWANGFLSHNKVAGNLE